MFRLSPRRSHRSQGFKVKHALQLFLLLSVSIWLLYQVRHSRESKAEFDETARAVKETVKFGRKDLLPRMDDAIIRDVRHREDEVANKIEDHSKPAGIRNVEIRMGGGEVHEHENQRVNGETNHRWDSLYGKQHREGVKEDASGGKEGREVKEKYREDEETEESREKENEENKDEDGTEKENEENTAKESEDKEGEESKEHENAETENEENKKTESEDKVNEETHEGNSEAKESGEENEGEESKEEVGESGETEDEDKGTKKKKVPTATLR